jgi:MATE family multidrug resistance protein
VLGLGWGVAGAATGTVIAEVLTTVVVIGIMLRRVPARTWTGQSGAVFDAAAWRYLFSANGDLVIRTVLLSLSLALLNERGARLGTLTLASNQILMQFYLLVATLIDGVSLGTEVYVGRAVGAANTAALRHVVRRGMVMALYWGSLIAAVVAFVPGVYLPLMTTTSELIAEARRYWPWQVVLPIAGVWAFLWDGVYFGATRTRALRNSMIVSAALFVPSAFVFASLLGNHGLWLALGLQLCVRALTLTFGWPALVRSVDERKKAPQPAP